MHPSSCSYCPAPHGIGNIPSSLKEQCWQAALTLRNARVPTESQVPRNARQAPGALHHLSCRRGPPAAAPPALHIPTHTQLHMGAAPAPQSFSQQLPELIRGAEPAHRPWRLQDPGAGLGSPCASGAPGRGHCSAQGLLPLHSPEEELGLWQQLLPWVRCSLWWARGRQG